MSTVFCKKYIKIKEGMTFNERNKILISYKDVDKWIYKKGRENMKDFAYEKIPKVYFGKGVLEKNLPNELKKFVYFKISCSLLSLQNSSNFTAPNCAELRNFKYTIRI